MVYEKTDEIRNVSDMWMAGFRCGKFDALIHVTEGAGDNLEEEDIKEGYVDYAYYQIFYGRIPEDEDEDEDDGGMWLMKEPYRTHSPEDFAKLFFEDGPKDESRKVVLCGSLGAVRKTVEDREGKQSER